MPRDKNQRRAAPDIPDHKKVGWINDKDESIDELLNVRDAANFLQLSIACLERHRSKRTGPTYIKLGPNGRVRYLKRHLLEWLVIHQPVSRRAS